MLISWYIRYQVFIPFSGRQTHHQAVMLNTVCQPDTLIIPQFRTKCQEKMNALDLSKRAVFPPKPKGLGGKTDNSLEIIEFMLSFPAGEVSDLAYFHNWLSVFSIGCGAGWHKLTVVLQQTSAV